MINKQITDNIINFAYFSSNFPHDFIERCWGDSDKSYLIPHFKQKLGSGVISKSEFMDFFMELDGGNKHLLLSWINENYKAFSHLDL